MSPSAEQCDIPLDNNHLSRIIDLIPTVEMQKCEGRHLLLGAVPQWNRTVEFDRRLRVEEKRVVVEVFWFLIVRDHSTIFLFILNDHYRVASSPSPCP